MSRVLICGFVCLLCLSSNAADRHSSGTLRWAESAPNCTLRVSDDGHIYYGLSYSDFTVTLGIDRQELEKIPHRAIPVIGVFISAQYRGSGNLDLMQDRLTLEFLKHRHVVESALEPRTLTAILQSTMDDVTDEIERHHIRKHPEQKESNEKELQIRLRDYTEMMDFVSTRSLHSTTLDTEHAEASGWVFFSSKNQWIGAWRKPEQLILRLPLENLVVEFPFQLPPRAGTPELRRRDAN